MTTKKLDNSAEALILPAEDIKMPATWKPGEAEPNRTLRELALEETKQLAMAGSAALNTVKHIRTCLANESLTWQEVKLELEGLGWRPGRVSNTKTLAQAPQEVIDQWEAKLIGYHVALDTVRQKQIGDGKENKKPKKQTKRKRLGKLADKLLTKAESFDWEENTEWTLGAYKLCITFDKKLAKQLAEAEKAEEGEETE